MSGVGPQGRRLFSCPGRKPVLWLRTPRGYRARKLASTGRAPCRCGGLRLLRPALPAAAFARRAPHPPQPSTSGGKSLILKRVADKRAPYSRFRSRSVSKTATRSEMFETPPLICSQPALERWLSTQGSPAQAATFQKPPLISRYLLNREVFRAAFTFLRRLSPHLHFSKLIEIGTLNLKSSSSQIINPL